MVVIAPNAIQNGSIVLLLVLFQIKDKTVIIKANPYLIEFKN